MTEIVNLIFHIMKIFNIWHQLAFKQVVRFQSPSVYFFIINYPILAGFALKFISLN